ncbi:MAG: hypothetical protein K5641_02650 [Lachnospiraceae bacterium]|nr:hypothetical protein [Lachnospiraceae bacterium]
MKKRTKTFIGILAIALCIAAAVLVKNLSSAAEFDTSKAITFEEFSSKNAIDNTTLFIGTYLIYMDSVTDELYTMASASASDSGQFNTYYKSEIAGGAWFDISDAEGIKDISDSATPVPITELNPLWITYVVGKDGTVRDAKSMAITNPFNVPDPYDLYNLPQMEPIRNQYDLLVQDEGAKGESDDYYRTVLLELLSYRYKSSRTDECDQKIDSLFALYNAYLNQDKKDEADIVFELMSRVDAVRRAEVMNWIIGADEDAPGFEGESALDSYTARFTTEAFRKEMFADEDEDEKIPELVIKSAVNDAMGDARSSCNTAYNEYVSKQLIDGDTVLKHAEYLLSSQAIDQASGGVSGQMDRILSKLRFVYNIESGVIEDIDGELNLIETELLPAAQQNYISALSMGEPGEYKAAVSSNYERGVRNQILEDQKTQVNQKRTDLQMMISSKTDRMDARDALEFTNGRIELTNTWRGNIRNDAFKKKASETVDEHIEWLKQHAQSIIDSDSSLKSELDLLKDRKDELLELKQEALDDNDRNKAAKIDTMIAEVDKQIAAKTAELEDAVANGDAAADVTLRGAGTENGANEKLKQKAIEAANNGDRAGALDAINALTENGAADALSQLANALKDENAGAGDGAGDGAGTGEGEGDGADAGEGADGGDSLANELAASAGEAVEKAKEVQKTTGLGTGTEKPSATSGIASLTGNTLDSILADILGGSFDSLDAKGKVIAAAAMNRVGKLGSGIAAQLATTMIMTCRNEGNRYTYAIFEADAAHTYFSAKALGYASGYRYSYSTSKQEATLSSGGKVYRFKVNSNKVTLSGDVTKDMKYKTGFQSDAYIPEDDTAGFFDCKAEYIESTKLAACLPNRWSAKADEIVETCKKAAHAEGVEE